MELNQNLLSAMRGTHIKSGSMNPFGAEEAARGDAYLNALAGAYVKIADTANAGVNADGTIGFSAWFSAYLQARHAGKVEGKPFPNCVSEEGYKNNISSLPNGCTDLIVGTGLIGSLGVLINKSSIALNIGFHSIPVRKADGYNRPVSANVTTVKFPRSADSKESDVDIAVKFLRFALSQTSFSFHNLALCNVIGLAKDDVQIVIEKAILPLAKVKVYANPVISFSTMVPVGHPERYEPIKDTLRSPENALGFKSAWEDAVKNAVLPLPIARFSGDYFGDNLWLRGVNPPAYKIGVTVENTFVYAVDYEINHATQKKVDSMSSEEVKNTLFGDDDATEENVTTDATEENVATDATSSNDGASEDVAGGDDDEFMDEDDTSDVDMALFGSRVERILKLYDSLYSADPRNIFSYKYVAVLTRPDLPSMSLYGRREKATADKPWNAEFPFGKVDGAGKYNVSSVDFIKFCTAAKNIWKGLASSYPAGASAESYSLKKSLPQSVNDFEWLSSVMSNGEPSVSWFPFIHLALMRHIAPWDIAKEKAGTHGWKELRGMLQKWFLAVFRALGDKVENNEHSLDALCESFMRHFIVAGGNQTFTFSVYWDKKVQMDVPSLSAYFGANEDTSVEMLNEVNTLVTCESSNVFQGVFTGGFTPNLKAYLGDTLLGYDVVLDYLKAHNNILAPTEIPLGQSFRGKAVTINLNGGQSIFPAVVRAGARSGKGVLTQLLMITMLGCGYPFVYFDDKPDMSKTWADWGRKHGVSTLAADIRSDYRQFVPAEPADAINPCQFAVMMSPDYIGLLNFIYFGKLIGLLGGIVQARLKREGEFRKDNLFVFIDEVNKMGGDLKNIAVPKNPSVGMKYAEAKKIALAMYKKSNKDAIMLPADYDITVQGVGTFTVGQWDAVVGTDGKCSQLNKKLTDLVGALGKFVGSLSKDAPVAHVYGVLIGQTTPMLLTSMEASFGENVGKAFREASRMALFGRMWGDMESSTDELKGRLEKASNSQLTDITPGIFLYKKGASEGFTAIKTGVVLAENDALSVEYNNETGQWEGGDKDFAKMLLNNVKSSGGASASETFKEQKLLVTPKMQRILADGGMSVEVGSPNPLVTFDGLLEYVANKTGNSPTEPVQALYDEFSRLLTVTGSGFTDAYTYLLDPSAIYVEDDFLTALVSGNSILQGSADSDNSSNGYFSNMNIDLGDGDNTKGNFTASNTPMPVNPARATTHVAPATQEPADSSFGRGAMPTFESAMARQEDMARADAERRAETEDYASGEGFEEADNFGDFESAGGEATGGEYTEGAPDIDYYADSADDGGSSVTPAAEYESGEMPVTRTAERRTPAPVVCGTGGASSRYAGGSSPYAENSDGTITLEVPGGKVTSYYTAAETVQTLSRLYDDDKARKLAQTPKGRNLMALESMRALVKMLEDKTGLNRAMIKSVTFADNCLFVRDACVIGGKPDSYDLYDYVDIKNFLKAMSGLTVLRMDRNAYFNLIVRPGCSAQDAFLYSQTLQTFQFDNCQMLRDGRIVGETPDAAKDSFIADFDKVATENSIPTSKSKLFSGAFRERAERESKILHTPEYQEKSARLTKLRRDLYGKKAEQYIEEDRPISGFFSALRFWLLDKKLARVQSQL